MRIQYVGTKAQRADTVAGTGLVWIGAGDVQEVPNDAAAKLLKHPDIWREAAAEVAPIESKPTEGVPPDCLDDAGLKAYAAEHGLKVDGRKKGAALLQAVRDAIKPAQE